MPDRFKALIICFAMIVGCGGDATMGEVIGTVTIDGKVPPKGSSINFVPVDGKSPSAGATIVDGKYSARVPVGKSKVEIRAPRELNKAQPQRAGPGPGGDLIEESLPAKYNDATELTVDVKPGKNEKTWNLSSK